MAKYFIKKVDSTGNTTYSTDLEAVKQSTSIRLQWKMKPFAIWMEFLDPIHKTCWSPVDMTCSDVFVNYDLSLPIPCPYTREKAATDRAYENRRTLAGTRDFIIKPKSRFNNRGDRTLANNVPSNRPNESSSAPERSTAEGTNIEDTNTTNKNSSSNLALDPFLSDLYKTPLEQRPVNAQSHGAYPAPSHQEEKEQSSTSTTQATPHTSQEDTISIEPNSASKTNTGEVTPDTSNNDTPLGSQVTPKTSSISTPAKETIPITTPDPTSPEPPLTETVLTAPASISTPNKNLAPGSIFPNADQTPLPPAKSDEDEDSEEAEEDEEEEEEEEEEVQEQKKDNKNKPNKLRQSWAKLS